MKDVFPHINKLFESRIRLGVMSILVVNECVDFNALKDFLQVTDGNLASHLKSLERNNFIMVKKQFIGRKPNTNYSVTEIGEKAFSEHLNALEEIIKIKNKNTEKRE